MQFYANRHKNTENIVGVCVANFISGIDRLLSFLSININIYGYRLPNDVIHFCLLNVLEFFQLTIDMKSIFVLLNCMRKLFNICFYILTI